MYVNILLFHVVRDILSFIVYRMSNTKIGLQNPSAICNLLDFGFVDASDSTISTKESSPLSIDESLNDEAINNKQIMDGDMKRKLFQRKETCSMYCKTPAKIPLKPMKLISQDDLRKRTKSFKTPLESKSSMSIMMNDDSSYLHNEVVSKSKASLFKELTCIVMQSSHFIKTMPEVDLKQLEDKKVYLPYKSFGNNNSTNGKIKTIIFDMDETLIHKIDSSDKCKEADVYVSVPTEDNSDVVKIGFNI